MKRNMLIYTWAVGLGKFSGTPRGSSGYVMSWRGRGSKFPGLGSTPEKRHETCQYEGICGKYEKARRKYERI